MKTQSESDLRIPCKYGEKCYQTNQYHVKKYKHTPTEKKEIAQRDHEDGATKRKSDEHFKSSNKIKRLKANMDDKSQASATTSNDKDIDIKTVMKEKYHMEMPDDFYELWVFCKSLSKDKPGDALLKLLGLKLVGPFDCLSSDIPECASDESVTHLMHYRYYYDPPEFVTLLTSNKPTQYHLGYFRDDPNELPAFVGSISSKANKNPHTITIEGDNLFSALRQYVQTELKMCNDKAMEKELKGLDSKLLDWCRRHSFSEDLKGSGMIKKRKKCIVCKSFHGAGLVVDMKNDVGYRELPYSDGDLHKLLRKISGALSDSERLEAFEPLQEIVTLVQFANDECDYGMGLELGIDMFCHGSSYLHKTILSVLPLAYQLLGRELYADIITAHLQNRTNEPDKFNSL